MIAGMNLSQLSDILLAPVATISPLSSVPEGRLTQRWHNAGRQAPPEVGARYERTLEAVACTP